ncbi:DUF6733 family protein [Tenacibaculum maritimum]|uniref:Secreted protein n=1 Tax=Tenacibaculum maritimum NCIMB 2154 TaxID=1349785 RepID=A0A2H1EBA7_9FLAO|nr:DUF6733 family protein [Tenacibaculum maritimum]MCD9563763.1 hypothetical protein [Tenacibaculum maritimum]MCD9566861.1 hypothetical protein [Tenacibaculum maritimum]MCD9580110.1 hypothetical protein [Tenacibaculum maritimum]MCD9586147.1 hypothetical protein [Tenacibaculum maritimum]MCD9597708.1 hypothetical protein [Tenacibaculum maritimum]
MKKLIIIALVLASQFIYAQEEKKKEKKKTSFAIMPIHNSVAGFNNVFLGSIELKKNLNLTFYSIFWNNPTFGNLQTGSDLFLETGVGLGFTAAKGKWYINPTLGFGHGKFLSGGTETRLAEGIIPSIFTVYNSGRFELEAYLAYYKNIRDEGNSRDLLLNWVIPGVKVTNNFSAGAFFEQFSQLQTDNNLNEKEIYQFMGGYLKFSLNNGVWFRLAAGPNLATSLGTSKEFYKVQAFIPL